jgi:hypothetical protein
MLHYFNNKKKGRERHLFSPSSPYMLPLLSVILLIGSSIATLIALPQLGAKGNSLCQSSPSPVHSLTVSSSASSPVSMLVPAFWGNKQTAWSHLDKSHVAGTIASANINDGPSSTVDPGLQKEIAQARSAGIQVIGYVNTGIWDGNGYSPIDEAKIKQDIDSWYTGYQLDGIQLDTTNYTASNLPLYKNLHDYIKSEPHEHIPSSNVAGTIIYMNGADIPSSSDYLQVANILNIYEAPVDGFKQQLSHVTDWMKATPASRFSVTVSNVPTSQIKHLVQLAYQSHVGYVYMANKDQTYTQLSTIWDKQVQTIEQVNSTLINTTHTAGNGDCTEPPTPTMVALATARPTSTIVPTVAHTPKATLSAAPIATVNKQGKGFRGIFVFNGNNTSTFSDNPSISGTYLGYYWSQLEPQQGQYNWSLIDHDMQPWVANGKSVLLRVSTAGWTSWQPPHSKSGTPQWVYDQGVSSVTETDGSVIPQYWNPTFLQNLSNFVQALASRYDGNPHISAVEIGVGVGGETKPDTHNNGQARMRQWQAIGYTNAAWWSTVQRIITMYTSSFHQTPLVVMPDATFIGKEKGYSESMVLNYAVTHNLWLQDNGLVANRTLPAQWKQVPTIAEQRQETSQSGDTLQQDMQAALNDNAAIILVFSSDLSKSSNQPVLQQTAALVAQQK